MGNGYACFTARQASVLQRRSVLQNISVSAAKSAANTEAHAKVKKRYCEIAV